eukprot:393692-Amphidinium_carterae.1
MSAGCGSFAGPVCKQYRTVFHRTESDFNYNIIYNLHDKVVRIIKSAITLKFEVKNFLATDPKRGGALGDLWGRV